MRDLKDEQIEEAVEQRATEWFVRHRERELTAQEQKQYMEWLQASPRHVEAYLSLIGLTAKLPEAMAGLGVNVEALAQKVAGSRSPPEQALFQHRETAEPRHSRFQPRMFGWAAALLIAVAGALYGTWDGRGSESIAVPAGQQRMLTLADGSIAHFNADTRVVVRYSETQRLIELSEGQALFSVMRDPRRPFIVRTGSTDVVAVGTRFDVYRRGSTMQVTVVEGKVEILRGPEGGPATPVSAGEQVRIEETVRVAQPVAVDVSVATAWARNEVAFAGARLEDVAAQFNRHAGSHIEIDDPLLRDYRISGVFQAYDLDSFVAYLEQFDGIAVKRRGAEVRVSSRK